MNISMNRKPQGITTISSSHFISGLAQHAFQSENLSGLVANAGTIESITIVSEQNLAWEVSFFGNDKFVDPEVDDNRFLGKKAFATTDAQQYNASGVWHYASHNLGINYADQDGSKEIHAVLANRSATAKNAGLSGEITMGIAFRPEL